MTDYNNNTASPLFLGIDAGGSTCRARLSDDHGHILGEASTGPANWRLGLTTVTQAMTDAARNALQQAGLADIPLSSLHAGIGLAGFVLADDEQAIQPLKTLFADCVISHDAYIACLGTHQGEYGGIVIVGTGSCAQIIAPQASRTFGGWGMLLSDHASGAFLGQQAIRFSLQANEQLIAHSGLTDAIAATFQHQPERYLTWSLNAQAADYARFAPLVFQHAAQQDPHALALLSGACRDLTGLIKALQRYQTGRVTLLGGLAHLYKPYLPADIQASLTPPKGDALDGALLMARQSVNLKL